MAGSQDVIELPKKCMPDESNFDIRLTRAAKDWSSFTKVDTTEKEDLISDLTEDFETRLGEFDSLMQMVTEETGPKLFQNMVALQEKYRQLQEQCIFNSRSWCHQSPCQHQSTIRRRCLDPTSNNFSSLK